jgi:eukaryotic-like serine/threonine-protein kinase
VVTVHDFGVAPDSRAFLVMELLEGVTLYDALKQNTRLASARVLDIMRGVSAAVEAAHRRKLIHRDLKPENVFLARTEAGEVAKVLDFGIAKFLPMVAEVTSDTATGALGGTMRYMSPEQPGGGKADAAWDLWALAVLAYETLTGAHPFASAPVSARRDVVLGGHFRPVSESLPDTSSRLQEFFERALADDAARRPNSARSFFSELERALA